MSGKKSNTKAEKDEKSGKAKKSEKASTKAVSTAPKTSNQDPPEPTPVVAEPIPLIVPVPVPTETVSNVGQISAPPVLPPPPKPADVVPVVTPPKVVAAPVAAPAQVPGAVTVLFVESSLDLPADIRKQVNTVVYVRGSLRDENLSTKAPVNGLSRVAVLTQIDNLVRYCRSKQPQCIQPGVVWVYAGSVITVNESVGFSQFRYDSAILVRPGTSLSSAPTGSAASSPDDLVLNGSELGKDITLTLPGGSSVTVSQWVQGPSGVFIGFSISWQGPAGSYVVTDVSGGVYAMSSNLFASLDNTFPGISSIDFTDSTSVSTADLDRLPYFVVQPAQQAF